MRTIFMGTPTYALPALEVLAKNTKLVAVFSRKDAVSKRGNKRIPSPVSTRALELEVPLFRPDTLKDPELISTIAAYKPDLIVVAAYGMILPKEILSIPPLGCVNLHASILPRWRGAAPIERAILAGDKMSGVALMQMEEGLDTGAFSYVATTPIESKNTEELTLELGEMGADLLLKYLKSPEETPWQTQDEELVTYAQKIESKDVELNPSLKVQDYLRRVQASSTSAPARMSIDGVGMSISKAKEFDIEKLQHLEEVSKEPGRVIMTKRNLILVLQDGYVELVRLKADSKKEMNAADYARGARISSDSIWSAL